MICTIHDKYHLTKEERLIRLVQVENNAAVVKLADTTSHGVGHLQMDVREGSNPSGGTWLGKVNVRIFIEGMPGKEAVWDLLDTTTNLH